MRIRALAVRSDHSINPEYSAFTDTYKHSFRHILGYHTVFLARLALLGGVSFWLGMYFFGHLPFN